MSLAGHPLLRTRCFVDGSWIEGPPGSAPIAVRDPATDEVLAEVPALDDAAVDAAIAAAARAFPGWRDRPAAERATLLAAMAARMRRDEDALAAIVTAEHGKPLAEAVAEIRYAASFLEWFAGEAVRVYGETIPASRADQRIVVVRQPVGVCALITPWNFPAAMLTRKLGPALAVGCTVVAKPASQTPLTTLALAAIAEDCGLPRGVLNVVTGPAARIGARFTASPAVRKISFTGSTRVGQELLRASVDDLKRVSLELGGNAPFVVFDDADLDRAVAGAMVAKFRNMGQSCVAANRFLFEGGIAEALTARLVDACRGLEVGRGTDAGVQLGPLIDDHAVAKVRQLVDDAVAQGARVRCGQVPSTGRMVPPIVVDGVTPEMALWREEIFGPVLAIGRFSGEAEAVRLANQTEAGLVAYLFTRDLARAERVTRALEVGMVGVNEGLVSTAQAPFGGVKHSGLGREGSRHGLDDYTDLKYVMTTL